MFGSNTQISRFLLCGLVAEPNTTKHERVNFMASFSTIIIVVFVQAGPWSGSCVRCVRSRRMRGPRRSSAPGRSRRGTNRGDAASSPSGRRVPAQPPAPRRPGRVRGAWGRGGGCGGGGGRAPRWRLGAPQRLRASALTSQDGPVEHQGVHPRSSQRKAIERLLEQGRGGRARLRPGPNAGGG